jgi:PmbA protein
MSLKKETQVLQTAASALVDAARDAGASSAEVCGAYSQRTKISLEKQDFHLAASDEGFSLGLRVLRGKRQGFASCNTTDPKELREVAGRAVEIASFSPDNPNWTIQPSGLVPKEAPGGLWDERLSKLSLQTQKDWALLMASEAMQDSRFRLNEGSVEVSSGLMLVLNSLGTHQLQAETAVSWSLMGMAVEGSNITSFDYFGQMSRNVDGVADKIKTSARLFRDKLVENLNQKAAQSYQGLVLFTPRAVIDIFLSGLSYHFNGRQLAEGTTRWKREDLGRTVVSPLVNVSDNPWLTDRAGCQLFDREGTPTSQRSLLANGQLTGFLFDHYAATALGTQSTGNAVGGPSALPSVGPHCLVMAGGPETLQALHDRLASTQKEYLVVQRYSGQSDPVTGDFSGVAKGGEWWKEGKRLYCVKETLIAGNLFQALGSSLFGISQETEIIDCAEQAPSVVCDGISVTA